MAQLDVTWLIVTLVFVVLAIGLWVECFRTKNTWRRIISGLLAALFTSNLLYAFGILRR